MNKYKKAFVIAHYNINGQVAPDLLFLIKYLKKRNADIVFVSTNLSDLDLEIIKTYSVVIRRNNFGYDFWSYKIGIDSLGNLQNYDRITILNSSFLIVSLPILCDRFLSDSCKQGLRGLSISNEKEKHIQSFWVSFESNTLINSKIFKDWWGQMKPVSERQNVIDLYEIGMSRYFLQNDVPISAIYEPSENDLMLATFRVLATSRRDYQIKNHCCVVNNSVAEKLNPTHYLWDKLLLTCGIVKYDLIKDNRYQIPINSFYKLLDKNQHLKMSLEINSI